MLAGAPRAALACPVCFGQSDSPLAQGDEHGHLRPCSCVVAGVLAGFAAFFILIGVRAGGSRPAIVTPIRWPTRRRGPLNAELSGDAGRRRRRTPAEIDHMMVLVHWLMLVLFVGWGAFFVFVLVRFREGANPKAELHRRQGQDLEGPRSRRRRHRSRPARVLRDSGLGHAREGLPRGERGRRRARRRRAVRVERPLSRAPTASSAAPTSSSWRPTTRSASTARDPDAKDDITDDQPAEPSGQPAGARAPVEQGRHPQLRAVRDAREAGRRSRAWRSRLVHPESRDAATYEIACSQLCGLGHYRMRGFVVRAERRRVCSVDGRAGQSASPLENCLVSRSRSCGSVSPLSANAPASASHDSL